MYLLGELSADEEGMSEEDDRMEEIQDGDVLQRLETEEYVENNEEQSGGIQLETLTQQEEEEQEVSEQKGEKAIDEETKNEEGSTDISFPDTTILLTHLQSNR